MPATSWRLDMRARLDRQRGVSLIEALVAMLVLALGVMGIARVQNHTLTAARTTHLRADAVRATDDLLERIQANADLRLNPIPTNPYVTPWGPPAQPPVDCTSAPCNGLQLAAFDLAQWKSELTHTLPAGDAMVFSSETDANQLGILIAWTEAKAKNETIANQDEAVLFTQAVLVRDAEGRAGTGVAHAACPDLHTCHLVYIRP